MAEKKMPKISIGITSMTVILCVLCLTVFSVLTLSTAVSERNFSVKRAEATKAYYKAETAAAKLANGLIEADNAVDFAKENHIQVITEETELIFQYGWPIDEGQELSVELTQSEDWKITKWQIVSTADWTPDESRGIAV